LFRAPRGLPDAAAGRVGARLGSGDAGGAKSAAAATVALILSCELFLSSGVVAFRGRIARAYSSDADVLRLCDRLLPVLASFMVFDGCQAVMAGALRGAGKQDAAASINVVAFYAVGLPLSAWLGLGLQWGVVGIWAGIALAVAIQVVCYGAVLYGLDWAAAVDAAARRNNNNNNNTTGNAAGNPYTGNGSDDGNDGPATTGTGTSGGSGGSKIEIEMAMATPVTTPG
jgi:MATE family multidrug resistance protein